MHICVYTHTHTCTHTHTYTYRSFLMAQMVKHLVAVQETPVRSLLWEDPLEKRMATHSSILAWKTPWIEKPGGRWSLGWQRVGHDWSDLAHIHMYINVIIVVYFFHELAFLLQFLLNKCSCVCVCMWVSRIIHPHIVTLSSVNVANFYFTSTVPSFAYSLFLLFSYVALSSCLST